MGSKKINNDFVYHDFNTNNDEPILSKKRTIKIENYCISGILLLILVLSCYNCYKLLNYSSTINAYEEFYSSGSKDRLSNEILIDNAAGYLKMENSGGALKYVTCMNEKIDSENIPDNIKNIINEINNYYNYNYGAFAFAYQDINTGFKVTYNASQEIFTASTIKAPTDIYIYEMASQGKINLDDKLTYTPYYYNQGSGLLKNNDFNTSYDIRTLLNYSTVYSDNAAHNMLMDKFGRGNMYGFWTNLGTSKIFLANNNWGILSANDALIYMNELYNFYMGDSQYGEELMNNFLNSKPKMITSNKYKIASKSGWSNDVIHDVSLIFHENPYILVGLSYYGESDYSSAYFNKVSYFGEKLHTEYWKYKNNECSAYLNN